MTPSDELWIEMASFDTDLADGIWEGTAAPEVAPAWYGEVATLIRIAKAPALPDELVAEDDVVASMQAAILAAQAGDLLPIPEGERPPADEPSAGGEPGTVADPTVVTLPPSRLSGDDDGEDGERRGRGGRIVRRVVAVKAVAATTALAIGITAAAATTGIVTVVVPAARDRLLPKDSPSEVVEERAPEGDGRSGGGSRGDGEPSGERDETDAPASERSRTTGTDGREPGEPRDGAGSAGEPDGDGDGAAGGGLERTASTTVPGEPTAPDEPSSSPTTTPPTTDTTTTTTTTPPTTDTTITPMSDPGPGPGPVPGPVPGPGRQPSASTTSVVETYGTDLTVTRG